MKNQDYASSAKKLHTLQHTADILSYHSNLINACSVPVEVEQLTLKGGCTMPCISYTNKLEPASGVDANVMELNDMVALEILNTSTELVAQRYYNMLPTLISNRDNPDYFDLIDMVCNTFEDAHDLIYNNK